MGDFAANFWGVRVERGEFNLRGVAAISGLEGAGVPCVGGIVGADLALVADRVVDVGEERLLGRGCLKLGFIGVVD